MEALGFKRRLDADRPAMAEAGHLAAVRLGRLAEDSTRVRKLEEIGFCLCRPTGPAAENTRELPVVRYGDDLRETPEMRALDGTRPDARVAFKSNRLDILIEAALALGAEIMLPEAIAERDPRFAVVLESGASAARPMFPMIHPDRVGTPSVAAAASWVASTLQRWARR